MPVSVYTSSAAVGRYLRKARIFAIPEESRPPRVLRRAQALEEEIGRTLNPASMTRVYKTNTWAPAPRADALRLIEETDFALVGVGA